MGHDDNKNQEKVDRSQPAANPSGAVGVGCLLTPVNINLRGAIDCISRVCVKSCHRCWVGCCYLSLFGRQVQNPRPRACAVPPQGHQPCWICRTGIG